MTKKKEPEIKIEFDTEPTEQLVGLMNKVSREEFKVWYPNTDELGEPINQSIKPPLDFKKMNEAIDQCFSKTQGQKSDLVPGWKPEPLPEWAVPLEILKQEVRTFENDATEQLKEHNDVIDSILARLLSTENFIGDNYHKLLERIAKLESRGDYYRDGLERHIEEISKYECHNRALIEDLRRIMSEILTLARNRVNKI